MTSLAVLVARDSRRVSAVYLVTDSRISWEEETWDHGRKTFASRVFPDIYAYCGDVLFPSLFLAQHTGALDAGLLLSGKSSFAERVECLGARLEVALASYPESRLSNTIVMTCGRDGEGTADFSAAIIRFSGSGISEVILEAVPDRYSQMYLEQGSGAESVREALAQWQSDDSSATSRTAFSAFVAAINSQQDPRSGGAPQLVGVYNSFPAKEFGVWVGGRGYYQGMPVADPIPTGLEWRNEYFERCDHTGARLDGAAVHESTPIS